MLVFKLDKTNIKKETEYEDLHNNNGRRFAGSILCDSIGRKIEWQTASSNSSSNSKPAHLLRSGAWRRGLPYIPLPSKRRLIIAFQPRLYRL